MPIIVGISVFPLNSTQYYCFNLLLQFVNIKKNRLAIAIGDIISAKILIEILVNKTPSVNN